MKRAKRGLTRIGAFGEELPNIENRIELVSDKDEFGMPLAKIIHSYDTDAEAVKVLDEHCVKIGRDPRTLRRSVNLGWNGGEGLELAKRYRDIGFTEFIIAIGNDGADALREVDLLEREMLPKLRALA